MCKNATSTAASLMTAIRPTVIAFMSATGVSQAQQATVLAAFDAAQASIANWTPGTSAQTAIEALDAFTAVFQTLPIPDMFKALEGIISAGIVTVVGVLTANSPAPATGNLTSATTEETQAMHVAHVVASTTAKVTELVPGFKHSIWHSPAGQYKGEWNKAVDKLGPDHGALKVA